jgi:Trk K+ transport system NAD-binding subunit
VVVRENDSLDLVMKEFAKENVGEIPVVSSQDPTKILGTVWRIDVISAYNKEILKRDLEGEVVNSMMRTSYTNLVEVVDGFFMLEIEVPSGFVGKTIKDIGVRNKFGVDIILIRRRGKENKLHTKLPQGRYRFHKEDQLLIFGPRPKVEHLSRL